MTAKKNKKGNGTSEVPADGQQLCSDEDISPNQETDAPPEKYTPGEEDPDKLERENRELSDKILRTMAEFDNYRKRVAREKQDLIKYGTENLAEELLPVVDSFERALEQARSAEDVGSVIEGVEMILQQLLQVLERFNIVAFNSIGEQFDPQKHEAMAQQENADYEDNTVIEEYQKGYYLKDRLLRPARVIVSKASPENGG